MLYSDYKVKTLVNAEANLARLVIDNAVIKTRRTGQGKWTLDSVKFVKEGELVIDPTWKTDKSVDRLPDLDEPTEADLLDAILLCVEEGAGKLGIVQKAYEV